MKYIYIAGPYRGKTHDHRSYFEIDANIRQATEAAAALADLGVGFFCPHQHSAHFEVITPGVHPDYWYELDIHFLKSCDAILMLPRWEGSSGSRVEKDLMEKWGKPVFFSIEEAANWAKEYVL